MAVSTTVRKGFPDEIPATFARYSLASLSSSLSFPVCTTPILSYGPSMPGIRTIHTNYPSPVEKPLVDVSVSFVSSAFASAQASPTPNSKPGYSFRFPSTSGGTHGSTNLVVYIVPALFTAGLIFVFIWWLYVRRGRRARAKAFRESLEVEGEPILPMTLNRRRA